MKFKGMLLGLACISSSALAGWTLDNNDSRLSFISTKATNIAEVHHFGQLRGSLDDSGQAILSVSLDSVNTNIEIRDGRVKKELFEIGSFPSATYKVQLDEDALKSLAVGQSKQMTLAGVLDLHGTEQALPADVIVSRVAQDRILVSSLQPVVLNAASFGLEKGVNTLKDLAKLPSISLAVPVSFNLAFNAD